MAKYFLRKKARELRKKGISVNKIADELNVSKSTVSIWVRDIILTVEQLEKLRQNSIIGREKGRLKGSLTQKHKVLQKFEVSKRQGIKAVGDLTRRELLFVGLALYWAEGAKKNRNVRFCNSDPALIDLMLKWLKDCFGIKKDRLAVKVGINIIHKHREKDVKEYWSKITRV